MTGRRLILISTCGLVATLAVVLVVMRWDTADKIATGVSALAGVAAVGIAVWAAWPAASGARQVRVSRTGRAGAGAAGKANTGYSGKGPVSHDIRVDQTGDAEGGDANSGVQM